MDSSLLSQLKKLFSQWGMEEESFLPRRFDKPLEVWTAGTDGWLRIIIPASEHKLEQPLDWELRGFSQQCFEVDIDKTTSQVLIRWVDTQPQRSQQAAPGDKIKLVGSEVPKLVLKARVGGAAGL